MSRSTGRGSATERIFAVSDHSRSADSVESFGAVLQGLGGRGIRPARAVAGPEAEEAQDAEIILGDPLAGAAHEPDPPGGEIRRAAEVVEDRAVRQPATWR